MHIQMLDGEWQVSKVGAEECIPAVVPGSIHVDLQNAGVIPDPFAGDNELRVAWVAETDWLYKRSFHAGSELLGHDRVLLECEGLDTPATVRLNGEVVANTDNMFRRYAFDVAGKLVEGENTIEVEFASPVNYVRPLIGTGLAVSPGDSIPGSPYLRKAMYQWGWDWGPKIPTSGIWRSIRFAGYSVAKLDNVQVSQEHGESVVTVRARVALDRWTSGALTVAGTFTAPDGSKIAASVELRNDDSSATLEFRVEDPRLWWPNGYGEHPLYKLLVELRSSDVCLDSKEMRTASPPPEGAG